MSERVYGLNEASRLTGFSKQTLKKLIAKGSLKAEECLFPWAGEFRKGYHIPEEALKPYIKYPESIENIELRFLKLLEQTVVDFETLKRNLDVLQKMAEKFKEHNELI